MQTVPTLIVYTGTWPAPNAIENVYLLKNELLLTLARNRQKLTFYFDTSPHVKYNSRWCNRFSYRVRFQRTLFGAKRIRIDEVIRVQR